jgi:hypothetical protein
MGLVLTQLGCATSSGNPPYPTEWASIKSSPTQDGCPNLLGTYSNHGSAAFPPEAGAPPSLAEIFTSMARSQSPTGPAAWKRSWPAIPPDASLVSIDQTPEKITVTFVDSRNNRTPLNFRRFRFRLTEERVDDLFSCRAIYGEPSLRFFAEPQSHSSASVLWMEGGGTFVVLLKAVDGSLIVNLRSDSVALTLFILGSGYRVANLWYQYPLVGHEGPVEP